jgi:hypothetical protein
MTFFVGPARFPAVLTKFVQAEVTKIVNTLPETVANHQFGSAMPIIPYGNSLARRLHIGKGEASSTNRLEVPLTQTGE